MLLKATDAWRLLLIDSRRSVILSYPLLAQSTRHWTAPLCNTRHWKPGIGNQALETTFGHTAPNKHLQWTGISIHSNQQHDELRLSNLEEPTECYKHWAPSPQRIQPPHAQDAPSWPATRTGVASSCSALYNYCPRKLRAPCPPHLLAVDRTSRHVTAQLQLSWVSTL